MVNYLQFYAFKPGRNSRKTVDHVSDLIQEEAVRHHLEPPTF